MPDSLVFGELPLIFCFYGTKTQLTILANQLKSHSQQAQFDDIDDGLLCKLPLLIDENTLMYYHNLCGDIACQYDVDYDGFYIEVDNNHNNNHNNEITPLSKYYDTGSVFKFNIQSGSFGYFILIADLLCDVIDGILYDDLTLDDIDKQKRLYPQPIMLRIEIYIVKMDFDKLPKQMIYKASVGYPSPDDIAKKAHQYHFDNPYDENWWAFLQCLKDNNDILYQSDEPDMIIFITLKGNHKIISKQTYWEDYQQISDLNKPLLSKPLLSFGTVVGLEDIKLALLGKMDKIRLSDEMIVSRYLV